MVSRRRWLDLWIHPIPPVPADVLRSFTGLPAGRWATLAAAAHVAALWQDLTQNLWLCQYSRQSLKNKTQKQHQIAAITKIVHMSEMSTTNQTNYHSQPSLFYHPLLEFPGLINSSSLSPSLPLQLSKCRKPGVFIQKCGSFTALLVLCPLKYNSWLAVVTARMLNYRQRKKLMTAFHWNN